MISRVSTVAFQGVETLDIDVQVQIAPGLPSFQIVGLPDKAVGESRERVRGALHAMGMAMPPKRITVNLAPADVQKEGSHFDLPIALGLLSAMEILPIDEIAPSLATGELSLDGTLSPVAGILPAAMRAAERGLTFICPQASASEATWAHDNTSTATILAASSLIELVNHFRGHQTLSLPTRPEQDTQTEMFSDIADIYGQEHAKRALTVVAAGGHNMLMIGPPGAGKSMLAQRLPSILPRMTAKEALDVSVVYSVAGLLRDGQLLMNRPFRDPHHSASLPALTGGGVGARPGEISLAHNGVLFLDELPEFNRHTLEALRQPLEVGRIVVARANHHTEYPARCQLIAAMNPCRCGYLGDPHQSCSRAPKCAVDYQGRLSGPLLDRIDVHIEVPATDPHKTALAGLSEDGAQRIRSADLRREVEAARNIQIRRNPTLLRDTSNKAAKAGNGSDRGLPLYNAHLPPEAIETMLASLDESCRSMLGEATGLLRLTSRGYHRVLRVSRTIADLEGSEQISRHHLAEALEYRRPLTSN